ncbi:MAG: hypothetical protein JWM51_799 [Microbacteriaceae bacterium]|nr:hypothetical protein [Microbacteriaceae bacterium]
MAPPNQHAGSSLLKAVREVGVVAATAAAAVLVAGCSAGTPNSVPTELTPMTAFEHVHGIDVDTATGTGYIATHKGLFLLPPLEGDAVTAEELGDPLGGVVQDLMGFTVEGGTLYASGHPEAGAEERTGGPNLGLISSTDAETWHSISLGGEVDFHDLDVIPADEDPVIYGFDSGAGRISVSTDGGATWKQGAEIAIRDLSADPAVPGTVYATTAEGLVLSVDYAATFTALPDTPPLFLVDAMGDTSLDSLVGVDVDGRVWAATGAGSWRVTGTVSGQAQALTFVAGPDPALIVVDDRGVVVSPDMGTTWRTLVSKE